MEVARHELADRASVAVVSPLSVAVVVARLRNLFAAAMLTGIFSLLSAGLFVLMDAVDVAFTEGSGRGWYLDGVDARRAVGDRPA